MAPVPTFKPQIGLLDPFMPTQPVVPEPSTGAPTEIEFVEDDNNIIIPPPGDVVQPLPIDSGVGQPLPPLPIFNDEDRAEFPVINNPTPAPQSLSIVDLIIGDVPAVPRTNVALPTPSALNYIRGRPTPIKR